MQQLQKSYTLPNCTLVLDGMSDPTSAIADGSANRGAMTILTSAVCRFLGQEQQLSGGSEFFNSLIQAVNRYAQQQLSGLKTTHAEAGLVQITKTQDGLHEFSVQPEEAAGTQGQNLSLTTVQLFDLVEAIDQFLADRSTLPNTQFQLQPLSKREIPSQVSTGQRLAAPALGIAGLATAAAAIFMVGIPEVKRPEVDPTTEAVESVEGATGNGEEPLTDDSESTDTSDSSASELAAGEASSGETTDDFIDPDDVPDVEFVPPEITDEEELESISDVIFDDIDDAWNQSGFISFKTDAIYRVSSSADGKIVGYRGANPLAQTIAEDLPLGGLLYTAPSEEAVSNEPLAQLRVTFQPNGRLIVEPWGDVPFDDVGENSREGGLDEESLEELSNNALSADLYNLINGEWTTYPSFDVNIGFRVDVNIDGEIAAFEPLNENAKEFQDEIPLPDLKKDGVSGDLTSFEVIFKSSGELAVNPLEDES